MNGNERKMNGNERKMNLLLLLLLLLFLSLFSLSGLVLSQSAFQDRVQEHFFN